jgi:hypothetical protein
MSTLPDGSVVSASQLQSSFFTQGGTLFPMVGMIVSVKPSDAKDNLTAESSPALRGCRHECVVLVSPDYGQPNVMLDNVVIPPSSPSGIDNFEEDLPRGISRLIDNKPFASDMWGIDPNMLDGEWCVVGFIGGKLTHPFIMHWWPHPANVYDPSTSGNTPVAAEGASPTPTLVQYDPKGNRARKLWRKNGTMFMLNRDGSIYLDTTQAGRVVSVATEGRQVSRVPKGGHAQVDMKSTGQFEINWNDKALTGPQIGADSKFQTTVAGEQVGSVIQAKFEPSFPQDQPIPSPEPTVPPRATDRTIIQGREYEVIVKTSKLALVGQAGSNYAGEVDLLADALVKIKSSVAASVQAPTVTVDATDIKETATATLGLDAPRVKIDADFIETTSQTTAIEGTTACVLSAPSVNLNGSNEVVLLSPKIRLGSPAANQHMILGDELVMILKTLIDTIMALTVDITSGLVTPASQAALEALKDKLTRTLSNVGYCM